MPRSVASCPMCPKAVAVKFSTERLIVHDTPEGVECAGSGMRPPGFEPAPAAEWTPKKSKKERAPRPVESETRPLVPQSPPRKTESKGGSVWTVSGGLPGLGKRR